MTRSRASKRVKKKEWHRWGGKENIIGMYQDFQALFMTDPFMNTLFDMEENTIDHKEHRRRLGAFILQWWGDDDEYSNLRPGHPLRNLNDSHQRAKNCPMRQQYQGRQFTTNQMYTWIGYQHMAMESKGFKGEEYAILMVLVLNGLVFYHPFDKDVNNEAGAK